MIPLEYQCYIMIVSICITVLVAFYLRYGSGLASRIFASIAVISAIAGIVGIFSSTHGIFCIENLALTAVSVVVATSVAFRLQSKVVQELQTKSVGLQASTAQLASTAKQTAATAAQQASMVAEVSTTLNEIQATSGAAAENARAVLSDASEALRVSREGRDAVAEARRVMDLIGQVTAIVDTVSELAEKSNLLAVNASIEAAKAGEHGRGFAVVASEVRNLAEQSKTATRQIREAIQRTDQGRRAVDVASEVINRLSAVLDETTDKAKGIAGATQQQAAGIQQITDAMGSVAQGAQEGASAAHQIDEAVRSLEGLTMGIRDFVGGQVRARS